MRLLPFKSSSANSLGIELEFQIIDPHSYALAARAKDLIRNIQESGYTKIKPEITQSMIEINSSIHTSAKSLHTELLSIRNFLSNQGKQINVNFCGGGTHPFQRWALQKIFPIARYKNLSRQYRYLSKRSTVFGQHIHIGCANAEDAIYLTHAFARYTPQLLAISCSSPFYQGVDTGYHSSRSTIFTAFPTSGVMPYLLSWEEFSHYFYHLKKLNIISSMKDFYWDVRPKPEFGTVELRVCDTPLNMQRATILAAYAQALAHYLIQERPIKITQNLYYLYNYNRFQAARYGFGGYLVDAMTEEKIMIGEDILVTIKKMQKYINDLDNGLFISALHQQVMNKEDDAIKLRQLLKQYGSFPKVVKEQCQIWVEDTL